MINESYFKKYWSDKTSSLHRYEGDDFYYSKAQEHLSLMKEKDKQNTVLDIGCGAGELLSHMILDCNIVRAIDYSEKMILQARKRIPDHSISLEVVDDSIEFLKKANENTWIACGSINQYSSKDVQKTLINVFKENQNSHALVLFDCIDPLYYMIYFWAGLGRYSGIANKSKLAPCLTFLYCAFLSLFKRKNFEYYLYDIGFTFSPEFWKTECAKYKLNMEIVGSRYYEYRYHVLIHKE